MAMRSAAVEAGEQLRAWLGSQCACVRLQLEQELLCGQGFAQVRVRVREESEAVCVAQERLELLPQVWRE